MQIYRLSNIIPSGNLFAKDIRDSDLVELRALVELPAVQGKYRVWWNGKSLIDQLDRAAIIFKEKLCVQKTV